MLWKTVGVLLLPAALALDIRRQYCKAFAEAGLFNKCRRDKFCEEALDPDTGEKTCVKTSTKATCDKYSTSNLTHINKCRQETLGDCYYNMDKMKCQVRRNRPEACRPCTGYPTDVCWNIFNEKECRNVEDTSTQHCDWIGWTRGYKCLVDHRPCSTLSEELCDNESWGECTMEKGDCVHKKAYKDDCKPCKGDGICLETYDEKTCKYFQREGHGCRWRGYRKGANCSPDVEGYRCYSMGDPHIHGFDVTQDSWEFMGIGEYVFLDSPRLKIQVRQQATKSELVASNLGVAFHGPDFDCKSGTATCSNTCGYTYELHPGNRQTKFKSLPFGDHLYEPTLIINNRPGETPEYWVVTGRDAIIDELMSDRCDQFTAKRASGGKASNSPDSIYLEMYDGSQIRLATWDHPVWGVAIYTFLNDWGDYNFFQPTVGGNMDGECNLQCNPVSCDDTMFTYFPDPQYANTDWNNRYAGVSQPYADFRNKDGWCTAWENASYRTDCASRPDPIEDCPEEIRAAAEALCSPVCDAETTQNCIFDSCVAEDISYAEEYVGTCGTVVTPVAPPANPPTFEPTPSPTLPTCGATFSPVCQQNSMECGTKGAYFRGFGRKPPRPIFTVYLDKELEGANTCSCEQFCLIKGGKWWIMKERRTRIHEAYLLSYHPPVDTEKCTHFQPADVYQCECYEDAAVRSMIIDKSHKRVQKNRAKGSRRGHHWGGVVTVLKKDEDIFTA